MSLKAFLKVQCFISRSAQQTSLQNKRRCRPLADKPIIDIHQQDKQFETASKNLLFCSVDTRTCLVSSAYI